MSDMTKSFQADRRLHLFILVGMYGLFAAATVERKYMKCFARPSSAITSMIYMRSNSGAA